MEMSWKGGKRRESGRGIKVTEIEEEEGEGGDTKTEKEEEEEEGVPSD